MSGLWNGQRFVPPQRPIHSDAGRGELLFMPSYSLVLNKTLSKSTQNRTLILHDPNSTEQHKSSFGFGLFGLDRQAK